MSRSRVVSNKIVYETNWPRRKPTGFAGVLCKLLGRMGVEVIAAPPHGMPGGWLKVLESTFEQEVNGQIVQRGWSSVSRNGQTGLSEVPDAVVVPAIHIADDGTRSLVITDEFRVPLNAPGQDPVQREHGFVAGLVEKGQAVREAAANELKQETGLEVTRFVDLPSPNTVSSAGLSNECSQFAFCYCKGTPSRENLEPGEDINTTLVPLSDILLWLNRPVAWSGRAAGIMFGLALSGRMSWDLREDLTGIQVKGNRALVLGPDGGEIALFQIPSGIPLEAQILDPMRAKLIDLPKSVAEELPMVDVSDVVLLTGKGTDEPVK